MTDPGGIHLRAEPLGDHVDEVVLEVLRYPRHECDADGGSEKQRHTPNELSGRIELVLGCVPINDVPEDQGIEKRKDLIRRGEEQREREQLPVLLRVRVQDIHQIRLATKIISRDSSDSGERSKSP